jgi:hypothetical protein
VKLFGVLKDPRPWWNARWIPRIQRYAGPREYTIAWLRWIWFIAFEPTDSARLEARFRREADRTDAARKERRLERLRAEFRAERSRRRAS